MPSPADKNLTAFRISLAPPEEIHSWSYGEVTKPETINYRRLRPEKDGLFCEAIFGPTRDYQCYCGKYKKIRYRGITCDQCGVQVVSSRVRRERMGHIDLASPVAHIWYARRLPSYLGRLLNISRRDLDRVLYFAQYIISNVDEKGRQKAIRHMEEEAERTINRLEKETEERIAEIEMHLEEESKQLEQVGASTHERLEEELRKGADEITSEAADIQKRIEGTMGETLDEPIVFSAVDATIVEAGKTVGRDHLTRLNELAQEAIEEAEAPIKKKQEEDEVLIEAEKEQLRQQVSEEIAELRTELEGQLTSIREQVEVDREEVMDLEQNQLLNEVEYRELHGKWGYIFDAGMGAEAIYDIVKDINLDALALELRWEIRETGSKQRRSRATKRLRIVEALRRSDNKPEWMILTVLPVIPPDLRPMIQLDGGRFATSDLNDLYRRVINRNNRLKRLMELGAPGVIIRNEKRMLQESVDSLIDNSRHGKAASSRGGRKLKSLSDMLKGKQGRFRRNLLGKRVDYSGRSVIVIGPHLKLHQCGLPKGMALELFRPFVIGKLMEYDYAHNVKGAKRLIEQRTPEVWEVLEEIVEDYPVLLNRAPTLHRLGIQAFQPVLVDGKAIQVHPLVCPAFNADFDGDQMAVHVPLSKGALKEAREMMMSRKNLLLPASGEPIVNPTKDMVLGCYYLTLGRDDQKGEGKAFANLEEVALAYEAGTVDLHAKIKVWTAGWAKKAMGRPKLYDTTVGRALFNYHLPEELRYVNETLEKARLKELVAEAHHRLGREATAEIADEIKKIGFRYATKSGYTIATEDLTIPEAKAKILADVDAEVSQIEEQYQRGLITEDEQYMKIVELWTKATDDITREVAMTIGPDNSIRAMAESGATKGGFTPIRQLSGIRGLMADPSGRIIALPIRSNFREGLTALEYFISTHGARKGLADTALRTADAGYLTRRLVDVCQDVIINAEDCGTEHSLTFHRKENPGVGETLGERILGRTAASQIIHPRTDKVVVGKGDIIQEQDIEAIDRAGIDAVDVYTPMNCELRHGVCAKCYGRDLARGGRVNVGEAVGVIAAQSIGEPGTQLTLRTFHTGGVAHGEDITQGLPRAEELFEARKHPKGEAILSEISGAVSIETEEDDSRIVRVTSERVVTDEYDVPGNYGVRVEDGEKVEEGDLLAKRGDTQILAERGGEAVVDGYDIAIEHIEREERESAIPTTSRLRIEEGLQIEAGEQLTEGVKNPYHILRILGREATQDYLLDEIQKVYRSQGVNINDKHMEIVIRQMLSRVRIKEPGDTDLLRGQLVNRVEYQQINDRVRTQGGRPAVADPVLLGITKAALKTESFLSAASFQHTIKVLADAAIAGKTDELRGLKENVIVGNPIPAGTGFPERQDEDIAQAVAEAVDGDGEVEEPLETLEEEVTKAQPITDGEEEVEAAEVIDAEV